ncbi:MAG: class I SAM-dependent methyltransferase [Chthoniobacterales bacterium]|nr:class I SAM-dependent methyltransferase [Chthoniobacterales bacterium]
MKLNRHPDSFLGVEQLGTFFPPYQPTFPFAGEYIDDFHARIGSCAKGSGLVNLDEVFATPIKGWLRRADALKLYELGYFVMGDILELGSYHGLSTCTLSRANHNTGGQKRIDTVDLSAANCAKTIESLRAAQLPGQVEVTCAEAAAAVRHFRDEGKRFAFVFIDHSHSYQPVHEVCRLLADIMSPGGFCLFHDFNDRRNGDSAHPDYGVYRAVIDGLSPNSFEFYGVYGCTALYHACS